MINWDNIKFLFQIPLDWYRKISDKVFKAYGNNFIKVRDGDYGAMEIDVDPDAFSNAVLEVTGGGSGGGTVKSVDGISPDSQGNVQLGAVRSINNTLYPDAAGNINVPTGVRTVNDTLPDAAGNVNVGTVRSIDSQAPDAYGNVTLNAISAVDYVSDEEFGILHLNAIRTINNRLSTDIDHNFNVNGVVLSVNGQPPDKDGNISVSTGFGSLVTAQNVELLPDEQGKVRLPNYTLSVNGVGPNAEGNIEVATGISSVNGIEPVDGNVTLSGLVTTVNGLEPDEEGNVELSGLVKTVNNIEPDQQGNVELTGIVKTVDGISPDAEGDVPLGAVCQVQGVLPDENGDVDFGLASNRWVKMGNDGMFTTSDRDPIVLSGGENGYLYADHGALTYKEDEYVTLSTQQTITAVKNWDNIQNFRDSSNANSYTRIDGSSIYVESPAEGTASLVSFTRSNGNDTLIRKDDTRFVIAEPVRLQTLVGNSSSNSQFAMSSADVLVQASNSVIIAGKGVPGIILSANDPSGGILLNSGTNGARLMTTPDGTDHHAIVDVAYLSSQLSNVQALSGYVTLSTAQHITGQKTFTQNINLSSATAERDATSRTAESKQIVVRDKDSNIAGLLSYGFNSDGSNQYMMIARKTVNGESKEASLAAYVTPAGVTQANIRGENVNVGPGTQADGRFILRGETGRIQFIPKSGSTTGGTIDFYYGGDTSNYSSRFIEDATALRMVSRAKNVTLAATDTTKLILLNTGANNSRLQNVPTIPRTDKTSLAIATCGWVNGHVDDAVSNLSSQYLTKNEAAELSGNFVALTGNQTARGQKTWQNKQTFNSTAQFNLQAIWGSGNQYTYIDNYNIETPKTVYRNPNAAGLAVGRITGESNVLVVDGDYGVTVNGNDYAVTLAANPNNAVLTNQPTSTDQNSLAIATVGYVQTHCDTIDPDNPPFSGTKKVITGVSWNGTQLKYSSETWTITNGKIMSVAANSDTVIDTPVAY